MSYCYLKNVITIIYIYIIIQYFIYIYTIIQLINYTIKIIR